MKRIQPILLAFLIVSSSAIAEGKIRSAANFRVVKTEKDSSLKATEAVFQFEFNKEEFRFYPNEEELIVQSSYNGILHEIRLNKSLRHDLKVAPGTYKFQFFANFDYEEIYSDSVTIQPGFRTTIAIHFQEANSEIIVDKPVIYLYPQKDLAVSATVTPKGSFNFTYPIYENGWKGTAHPDGSISIDGKTYPYLFWDATINMNLPINNLDLQTLPNAMPVDALVPEGFIVSKKNVVTFLEEKLTAIGLNTTEKTDFITYWGPRLVQNEKVFIQFAWGEVCNNFAEMTIQPQPDHINRLYLLWSGAETAFNLPKEQQLPVFDRSGFNVLEWGGSEIPSSSFAKSHASIH